MLRGTLFAALTTAVSLALGAGCALSPARQADMGRKEARAVVEKMGVVDSPPLADYVQSIADRLALHTQHSTRRFEVQVLDSPEPNAFALPGGYLFVSRGLLTLVNSEDELAGVIGHEIGHVTADHAVKRIGVAAPFAITTGLAGFATSIISPSLGRAVKNTGDVLTGGLVVAPFSREQERDADRIGVALAAQAGWDPAALSRFLDTMLRDATLDPDHEDGSGFLATHPATQDRVANTARQAATLTPAATAPIAANRNVMLTYFDGLLVGENPAEGVFVGPTFMQPDMGFALRFPTDWKTHNLPTAVVASHPSKSVQFALQIAGKGDDPWVPYSAATEQLNRTLPVTEFEVAGTKGVRTAVQTRTSEGMRHIQVAWIPYDGLIYEFISIGPPELLEQYEKDYDRMLQSFHALTDAEREKIQESRLRIAHASAGESLSQLIERANGDWALPKTAIANRLPQHGTLDAGRAVKIPVRQPYRAGK